MRSELKSTEPIRVIPAALSGRQTLASGQPHHIPRRHAFKQRPNVRRDAGAVGVIIGGQAIDQIGERAGLIQMLPDVAADVVEALIMALLDAHHHHLAVDLRVQDRQRCARSSSNRPYGSLHPRYRE